MGHQSQQAPAAPSAAAPVATAAAAKQSAASPQAGKEEDEESVDLDISDDEGGGLEAGQENGGSDVDEDWADWN